jgi:nucleotide-binding universal stress UspA family protein
MEQIRKILCAVDGSQASEEAAREAVALARAGAQLEVVAIDRTLHQLLMRPGNLREEKLREALRQTLATARKAGVSASGRMLKGLHARQVLLEDSRRFDLLVLGTHGHSRASGIGFARTASELAHRTEKAVLVARERAGGSPFPARILLASDGSRSSWAPAKVAAGFAESLDSEIAILHVFKLARNRHRAELDLQIAMVEAAMRRPPQVIETRGLTSRAIIGAAERHDSSLVILGHRGLRGPHALMSVGERVFHQAPCSVLLAPQARTGIGGERD